MKKAWKPLYSFYVLKTISRTYFFLYIDQMAWVFWEHFQHLKKGEKETTLYSSHIQIISINIASP